VDRKLLIGACGLLLVANAFLIYAVKKTRAEAEELRSAALLMPGTPVSTVNGVDTNGNPLSIIPGKGKRTVLFVFSPTCKFCEANWKNWSDALSKQPVTANIAFLSALPSLPPDYLTNHVTLGHPVLARVDGGTKSDYHLSSTPQTIVIGKDGLVEKVWLGVLDSRATAALITLTSAP
jgi:hypothetical protein